MAIRTSADLPAGTKPGITVASVLRGFAANIEHAAKNCGNAGLPYRHAYLDALRRAREAEWLEKQGV